MINAMIKISENANQILNIVKARHNFKDKSEAIEYVTIAYGEDLLEPELKPEFIEEMKNVQKQKAISFKSVNKLRERYEKR